MEGHGDDVPNIASLAKNLIANELPPDVALNTGNAGMR
jgi:hypothetical protein